MKKQEKPQGPAGAPAGLPVPEQDAGPIRRTDVEHADQLGSEGTDPQAEANRAKTDRPGSRPRSGAS